MSAKEGAVYDPPGYRDLSDSSMPREAGSTRPETSGSRETARNNVDTSNGGGGDISIRPGGAESSPGG